MPQATPPLSATSRALVDKLAAIDMFALGGVGFAGTTSEGEALTLALAREPDAVEAFTWLGRAPRPAPRLYAYWALRTLAPDRAAALAPELRSGGGAVERMVGCNVSTDEVAKVLRDIEQGAARAMLRP